MTATAVYSAAAVGGTSVERRWILTALRFSPPMSTSMKLGTAGVKSHTYASSKRNHIRRRSRSTNTDTHTQLPQGPHSVQCLARIWPRCVRVCVARARQVQCRHSYLTARCRLHRGTCSRHRWLAPSSSPHQHPGRPGQRWRPHVPAPHRKRTDKHASITGTAALGQSTHTSNTHTQTTTNTHCPTLLHEHLRVKKRPVCGKGVGPGETVCTRSSVSISDSSGPNRALCPSTAPCPRWRQRSCRACWTRRPSASSTPPCPQQASEARPHTHRHKVTHARHTEGKTIQALPQTPARAPGVAVTHASGSPSAVLVNKNSTPSRPMSRRSTGRHTRSRLSSRT